MKLTQTQYERIKDVMPRQRGNVRLSNLNLLNAILYIAENGCKWRALPKEFGNWNTICVRLNRWAKKGILNRIFDALQRERLINVKIEVASLDSTIIKVHPNGTGALKKADLKLSGNPEADGQPKFIWLPRMLTPR